MRKNFLFFILFTVLLTCVNTAAFSQDVKLKEMIVKLINSGEVTAITVYNTSANFFIGFDGQNAIRDHKKFKLIENDILFFTDDKEHTCYVSLLHIKTFSFNSKTKLLTLFL